MSINYKLYKFDVYNIITSGVFDEKKHCCEVSPLISYFNSTLITKSNSLLFDQIKKALPNISLDKVLVIMDFSNMIKNNCMNKMYNYENGFILDICGETIHFVDFLKSNSMSKKNQVYYINKEYYDLIKKRITFDFDDSKRIVLSKWYAYSGLSLTDCDVLNLKLKSDEVLVIPDLVLSKPCDFLTLISIPKLYEYAKNLKSKLKNYDEKLIIKDINNKDINNLYDKIRGLYFSDDYNQLQDNDEINSFDTIKELFDIFNLNVSDGNNKLSKLIIKLNEYCQSSYEVNWKKINLKNTKIDINCYDGVGLISKEFSIDINEKLDRTLKLSNEADFECDDLSNNSLINYSFQIRLPFIKGMVHTCDIKGFFKEHNITELYGLDGSKERNLIKYNPFKIKLILTESQFKGLKYLKNVSKETLSVNNALNPLDYYFKLLDKYDYSLGISNKEFSNKIGNLDNKVKLNYQYISTLPLKSNEYDYLIKDNYIMGNKMLKEDEIIDSLDKNSEYYKVYEANNDFFLSTKKFKDIRNDKYNSLKNEFMQCRLIVSGCRKYLCPDLLGFLYYLSGINIPDDEKLGLNYYYDSMNSNLNNQTIMMRNPHYSRNEIVVLNRDKHSYIRDKYFKDLYGVVMVNPLSFTAERLGGADYDGDSVVMIFDERIVSKVSKRLINKVDDKYIYNYPLANIPSLEAVLNDYTYNNKILCFKNTFSNRVGMISNQAYVDSINVYNKDIPYVNNKDEFDSIAKYTMLSGLEIDSVKNGRIPHLDIMNSKDQYLRLKNAIKCDDTSKHEINKLIDDLGLFKDINNVNYVSYNMSLFTKEKLNIKKYDLPKALNIIDSERNLFIAINEAYNYLVNYVRNFINYNTDFVKDNVRVLDEYILDILRKNNYLIYQNELDDIFKNNSRRLLYKYIFNDIKYHYLLNESERLYYLYNVLEMKPNDLNKVLIDFNNGGNKLLFYSLCKKFLKEEIVMRPVSIKEEYNNEDFNSNLSKELSKKDLNEIGINRDRIIIDIINKINGLPNKSINNCVLFIKNEFKNYTKNINCETLINVSNVFEYNRIFDIYLDNILMFLKGGN